MPLYITYFVHATTVDNERHVVAGWSQGELSKTGIEQAKDLGGLVHEKFDIVVCSDLRRAVDTAHLAFGNRFEIVSDWRLREVNYGDLTGMPSKQVKSDLMRRVTQPFPNGESYSDVERRISAFLSEFGKAYDGKHIALVAHQAPQLALDVILSGRTWNDAFQYDWRHTKSWQPGWHYILEGSE